MALIPVILAGGSGHRLWPLSNEETPKVFLTIDSHRTLIQQAIERALLLDCTDIVIVINEKHFSRVQNLLNSEEKGVNYHFILEPFGRNTAPAIAAALKYVNQRLGPSHNLLILPADHLIKDARGFAKAIQKAASDLNTHLVTFGALPTYPHTGYGYIQIVDTASNKDSYINVKKFVEKPSFEQAVEYLDSKAYLWNMGMFYFPAPILEQEMRAHAPDLMTHMDEVWVASSLSLEGNKIYLNDVTFDKVPNISIDYALMEKTNLIKVMPLDIGWCDLGEWNTFASLFPKSTQNNTVVGDANIIDANNVFVYNVEQKPIKIIGVKDLIVVNHANGILIVHSSHTQQVKALAERKIQEETTSN